MAGLNDKAGADGLNLPPWAGIQCCPHPYISEPMLLVLRYAINFENVMRRQMRQPRRHGRADRSRSSSRSFSVGSSPQPRRSPRGSCPASGRPPRAGDDFRRKGAGDCRTIGSAAAAATSAVAAMTAGVTARFSALPGSCGRHHRMTGPCGGSGLQSSSPRSLSWLYGGKRSKCSANRQRPQRR